MTNKQHLKININNYARKKAGPQIKIVVLIVYNYNLYNLLWIVSYRQWNIQCLMCLFTLDNGLVIQNISSYLIILFFDGIFTRIFCHIVF